MSGELGKFMGMKIIASPLVPETKPRIELSSALDVSPEFRDKCNAFYLEFFGLEAVMYVFGDTLATNPVNVAKIKAQFK